jgi:hypothetical protein
MAGPPGRADLPSAAVGDIDHDGPVDIVVGCNDAKVYGSTSTARR